MSTSQESRAAARRIVEAVLANHDDPASSRPRAPHPSAPAGDVDPARAAARRIVAEVLAAHADHEAATAPAVDEARDGTPAAEDDTSAAEGDTSEAESQALHGDAGAHTAELPTAVDAAQDGLTVEMAAAGDTVEVTVDPDEPADDRDATDDEAAPRAGTGHGDAEDGPPGERGDGAAAGPPPVPVAVLQRAAAEARDGEGATATAEAAGAAERHGYEEPRVYDEPRVYEEPRVSLDPVVRSDHASPRPQFRAARWLVATVFAAVALTVLLPMAVAALRDLVAL